MNLPFHPTSIKTYVVVNEHNHAYTSDSPFVVFLVLVFIGMFPCAYIPHWYEVLTTELYSILHNVFHILMGMYIMGFSPFRKCI
jgi:hypothetical protein